MNNRTYPKKNFVFMALAIFSLLAGIALFALAAWLMIATGEFRYFFISFAGMALFILGGIFMVLMGRIRVKTFWESHQANITISANSQNILPNHSKICPRCHEKNDNDALYCKKCGEKLS